jgi:hypothetical protein
MDACCDRAGRGVADADADAAADDEGRFESAKIPSAMPPVAPKLEFARPWRPRRPAAAAPTDGRPGARAPRRSAKSLPKEHIFEAESKSEEIGVAGLPPRGG